jgi:hypothetical protein
VLHFSDDETPSVLIVKLVRLTRNCPDHIFSYAVVFPKPNGMNDSQQRLLIHSVIT